LIELQNVSKYYGDTAAVQDLSFRVEKGETFGLIGTSGCGKTTTLKMINRLVEPTSGTITVDNQDITAQDPYSLRRSIGYVIQNVGLFPHYSVEENISTVPGLLDWDDREIRSRNEELLHLVGLDPETFADRKPDSLSGGQQQRVGLARALAADPPVILMDEPFGALDPITKQRIRREINQLFLQIDKTIVLVTHDVIEGFEMCDRLCLLDNGIIQQTGSPKELLFQPANDFVDSFFASDRFQLELMSVTLADLLEPADGEEELYWSPPPAERKGSTVEVSTPLYNIIEGMGQDKEANTKLIRRADGRVLDSLSLTDLFSAFQQFKRTVSSGDSYD
jgi:osmoprotectant transport system ATP-binding protein